MHREETPEPRIGRRETPTNHAPLPFHSTAATNATKATQLSNNDGLEILVRQRLNRPVAPHLTIYKPQITWVASSLNRVTGVALSGALYLFAMGYLAAPLLGVQMGSAALAAGFAKWPVVLQVLAKVTAALPFTFHSFNGLRHLAWDTGSLLTNPQVIKSGWTVVGVSVVSALGLALFV